jgi:hypothetical protein
MFGHLACAILCIFLLGSDVVLAEDCAPHCDYWHDYGPYDLSYIKPGMFGHPICDRQGTCSPYLVYTYQGRRYGHITIRPASRGMRPLQDHEHP